MICGERLGWPTKIHSFFSSSVQFLGKWKHGALALPLLWFRTPWYGTWYWTDNCPRHDAILWPVATYKYSKVSERAKQASSARKPASGKGQTSLYINLKGFLITVTWDSQVMFLFPIFRQVWKNKKSGKKFKRRYWLLFKAFQTKVFGWQQENIINFWV